MGEKNKMIKGQLYDPANSELVELRKQTRLTLEQYNSSSIAEPEKREVLLKNLLKKSPKNLYIEPPFYCDYGFNIELGENVYMNFNCIFLDVCQITVGNNVLFAPGVQVLTATHPLVAQERNEGLEFAKPIKIGHNCWIGAGVLILPGVTIGNNTTIAAGSVVTKDIPANVLAAGNPCVVKKEL
jgi:maltose O-acetyltransferase